MTRCLVLVGLLGATSGAEAAFGPTGHGWTPSAVEPTQGAAGAARRPDEGVQAWLSSRFEGERRRIALYATGEVGGLVTVEAGGREGTTGHDFGLLLSRAFGNSHLGATLGAAQSHQVLRLSDGHADFSRIAEDRSTLAAALGYSPSPALRLSAPLVLSVRTYAPAEGFAPPYARPGDFQAPGDDETLGAGVSLRWRAQSAGLVGRTGAAVATDVQYEIAHSSYRGPGQPPAHRFILEGEGGWDVTNLLAVETHVAYGIVGSGDPREATRLGGAPGFRGILPESVWCERHVAGALDVMVPLVRLSAFNLGAGAFGDAGVFNLADERQVHFWAAGASARLVRAADGVPLLAVNVGHNRPYTDFFFSVGLDLEVQ